MFEKDLPGANTTGFGGASVSQLPVETCETMNDSWGFNITDVNYKSFKRLIHYIVNAAGRNANFLLNIGPMPNGEIQQEFIDTLALIGKWMQRNGESIYGTRGNIIEPKTWGVVTAKDKFLYVHLLNKTAQPFILIPSIKEKINKATILGGGKNVTWKQQPEGVFIYLDAVDMDEVDTIIKLEKKVNRL
jgi:alpha-L-fucosidase